MQSSPPNRPAADEATSPEGSDYSLNLDALDMDDLTDLDIPQRKADRIFSEDIDGPSDFTQNMSMWMRGGKSPANTLKGTLKRKKPSFATPIPEKREEEEHQAAGDWLKMPDRDAGDGQTESHHTPDGTPPRISILDDDQQDDQFSSEWHTYDSTSTPAPPVHKQFLQPAVEDYHSELTPANRSLAQVSNRRSIVSPDPNYRIGRRSRSSSEEETLYDDDQKQASKSDLRELQAKCQQLEHMNKALSAALEEERQVRKAEKASYDSQIAEAIRRETDLVDAKEAAVLRNEEVRHEFEDLKLRLREQEQQVETVESDQGRTEEGRRTESQRIREQMQVQELEHKQEVQRLKQDLELMRKSRSHAEEALETAREQADEQRDAMHADITRLRMELQQSSIDENAITELERRLNDANAELKQLKIGNKDHDVMIKEQRDQAAKAKQSHEQESARLMDERGRAVELASGFQRQLQELRSQLKEEQTARSDELEKLRSEQSRTSVVSTKELDIIREELEAKQNELNEAILERDEAQDTLEAQQSNENALKTELEDMKAVNAELDARITEKLQKRERYWKEKLEEGDKERQLMAKALLHQWGREEVGIDSPQLYAYKYLSRGSPTKSPTKATSRAAA